MPIAAALPLLQTQIQNALNLGPAAQVPTVATIIASAVASAAPTGLFPPAPTPVPLVPAGLAAGQAQIQSALNLGPAAQQPVVAQLIALGVSLIAPAAPPAGLTLLKTQIENALNLSSAAQVPTVATIIASAIVQYYLAGGVI